MSLIREPALARETQTETGKRGSEEEVVVATKKLDGKIVVMGLQHTFVMFGATVLVPMLTGLDIGVTLFAAGIGTLIFHVVTKFKVPVFLGSSFAFIPGIVAVSASEGLPYALGGIVIAGLLYVVVAIIFKFVKYLFVSIKFSYIYGYVV